MHELESLITLLFNRLTGLHVPDYFVVLTFIMLGTLGLFALVTRRLSEDRPGILQQILEITIETLEKFLRDVIGHNGPKYLPIVGTFAVLILLSNLIGMIPGFMPPTGSIIVTLSLGLTSFLAYNVAGFMAQGPGYLKEFAGPVWWLSFLFIPIEIVSHLARPMSLGIRLFGNIFGDHQVGGVFLSLVPPVLPVPFILLGIFVAFVQTLVFSLLSMIYISQAVEHH